MAVHERSTFLHILQEVRGIGKTRNQLYTIDAQDKRDMRRRHPEVDFDWKTITRQLAEKREVCRRYRSRRRTARTPRVREPFYGVFDPVERAVYVNDPTNIAGMSAMLDAIIAGRS
jgi:hypothetical protein